MTPDEYRRAVEAEFCRDHQAAGCELGHQAGRAAIAALTRHHLTLVHAPPEAPHASDHHRTA